MPVGDERTEIPRLHIGIAAPVIIKLNIVCLLIFRCPVAVGTSISEVHEPFRRESIGHTDFPDIAGFAAEGIRGIIPAFPEPTSTVFVSSFIFQMIIRGPKVKLVIGMIGQFQELHIINCISPVPVRIPRLTPRTDGRLKLIAEGQNSAGETIA